MKLKSQEKPSTDIGELDKATVQQAVQAQEPVQSEASSTKDNPSQSRIYPKAYYTENSSQYYNYDMKQAPLGTKLICRNLGGTAVFAVLTHKNLDDFVAWAPLPIDRPEDKGRVTQIMNERLEATSRAAEAARKAITKAC